MLTRTGTKQRSDDRTTNLSRLIMTVICESVFICVLAKSGVVGGGAGGKPRATTAGSWQ